MQGNEFTSYAYPQEVGIPTFFFVSLLIKNPPILGIIPLITNLQNTRDPSLNPFM